MAHLDSNLVCLNPYERATLYYTIPRIARPLRPGFVFGYSMLLLGLLSALTVSAWREDAYAVRVVMVLVVAGALAGIAITMAHALLNEVRTRKVLKEAQDAPKTQTMDDTLPDPFAAHVLLRHPGNPQGQLTACTYADEEIAYFLDNTGDGALWQVRTAQDEPAFTIHAGRRVGSFALLPAKQREYHVRKGTAEVAHIRHIGSPLHPRTEIRCHMPEARSYILDDGIYLEGKLVGRIYFAHGCWYLDIEKQHVNEGTLAYFITLV